MPPFAELEGGRDGPDGGGGDWRGSPRKSPLREVSRRRRDVSLITHYGYTDGSGEYYIVVDGDKCDGCGRCVERCPSSAIELVTELVDLEDRRVAAVAEEHRRKLKYTCSPCSPEANPAPCLLACPLGALDVVWKPSAPAADV